MRTTYGMFKEDDDGNMFVRVYCKGAPEVMVELCTGIIEEGGKINK